jgi:hypothetical protein
MAEADVTQTVMTELKKRLPSLTFIKHCDRFTTGIPDLSISWARTTVWIEVKVIRYGGASIWDPKYWMDSVPQLVMVRRLRGFYYVYHPTTGMTLFLEAKTVFDAIQADRPISEQDLGQHEFYEQGKGYEKLEEILQEIIK